MVKELIKAGLAGLALLVLVGCESMPFMTSEQPEMTSAELDEALLEQVQFFRPYEIYNTELAAKTLCAAVGVDCQQNGAAPQQRDALLALKADVFNLGGNAVVLAHCQEVELKQCEQAIQCDGTGYVVEENIRQQQELTTSPLDQPDIWF